MNERACGVQPLDGVPGFGDVGGGAGVVEEEREVGEGGEGAVAEGDGEGGEERVVWD